MANTVTCPNCKHEINVDEELDHKLREQALASVNEVHKKELEEARKKAAEEALNKVEETNKKLLEEVKNQAIVETTKSLEIKNASDVQLLQKQLADKDKKVEEFRQQEIQLRADKTKLEEEKKDNDLIVQRRVDEEKKKAEENAVERVSNDYERKLLEKDKNNEKLSSDYKLQLLDQKQHMEGMAKKIEELQKKANLTSQQHQGETLEIDVQRNLTAAFLDDDIIEVEKFKNGSDIKHIVKSRKGLACGKILWECKRVNTFKQEFIKKLKEDVLREEANFGIIVSTTLPKEAIHGMAQIDGNIWICSPELVESLGTILRESLIEVAKERWLANNNKDGKGEKLVSYFISNQHAQQIREQAQSLRIQKEQINKEKAAFAKIWADRENEINRQVTSIAKVLSAVQSIIGPSMPQIEGFELTALDDGTDD